MWNSYFKQIQNKYSMRVSFDKPLVIRLDGKDVTKNKSIDLLSNYENSFTNSLEETVKFFSKKYNCLAIFGSDEVSFIFYKPMILIEDLDNDKYNRTNEVISVFSQYFFEHFNSLYNGNKVFWHGKCFSISNDKVNSYIKFRSKIIENVLTTYFLKKNNVRESGRIKLAEKIEMCKKYDLYEKILKKLENGILYLNGDRIDIEEFLNGNIKKIEPEEKRTEDEYFDITKWDI